MEIRKYDANHFTWFVAVGEGLAKVNDGGSISFRNYIDNAGVIKTDKFPDGGRRGQLIQYVTTRTESGKDVGKWFTLDESRRRFQTRDSDVDVNGLSLYDFFKNSPSCEGSPNGDYVTEGGITLQRGVDFRELNTDKDAEIALQAESQRLEAKSSAYKLDDATMQEVASFIGYWGAPGSKMKLTVLEYAEKRPSDYFKILNAGDRGVRAIIRKALADGLFTKKGQIIYWETTLIGGDEDQAVTTLLNDPQMLDVLQKKVDLGTEAKALAPKKKGGRPVGSKNKSKEAVEETK